MRRLFKLLCSEISERPAINLIEAQDKVRKTRPRLKAGQRVWYVDPTTGGLLTRITAVKQNTVFITDVKKQTYQVNIEDIYPFEKMENEKLGLNKPVIKTKWVAYPHYTQLPAFKSTASTNNNGFNCLASTEMGDLKILIDEPTQKQCLKLFKKFVDERDMSKYPSFLYQVDQILYNLRDQRPFSKDELLSLEEDNDLDINDRYKPEVDINDQTEDKDSDEDEDVFEDEEYLVDNDENNDEEVVATANKLCKHLR